MPSPPKSKLAAAEAQKSQQTEEILDSVLPPREWSEEGQLWVQRVSSTPATRLDVINLQVSSAAALPVRGYHRSVLLCSALLSSSGAAGHSTAAAAGQRNWDLPSAQRALLPVLW